MVRLAAGVLRLLVGQAFMAIRWLAPPFILEEMMQLPNLLPMLLPALLPQVKPVKRLAEQIREAYPDVRKSTLHGRAEEDYCVLGALGLYLSVKDCGNFPCGGPRIALMEAANSSLTYRQANVLSLKIMSANDTGNFNKAWALLDEALEAK